MNKIFYILILLITIFSCSDKRDKQNFEKILGKENIETLDSLVYAFEEDYLKIVYPEKDLGDSYRGFVESVLDNEIDYDDVNLKLRRSSDLFDESRLKYEIYKVVDSVFGIDSTDNNISLKVRYKFIDESNQFNYSYDKMNWSLKAESLDSILYKSNNTLGSNYQGKYLKVIKALKSRSLFFINLNKIIEVSGSSDYLLTSDLMMRHNVDFDDYFIRRMVITEIVY